MRRAIASWLRFVLGLVIALGLGIDSYFADRGAALTFVLPVAIGLLAVADFIGYWLDRSTEVGPAETSSSASKPPD